MKNFSFIMMIMIFTLAITSLVVENQSLHTKANKVAMEMKYLEGMKVDIQVADNNNCHMIQNQAMITVNKTTLRNKTHKQLKDLMITEYSRCK